jgi:hypothetical protein
MNLARQMDRLLEHDELMPLNRGPKYINRMSLKFSVMSTGIIYYMFIYNLLSFFFMPSRFGRSRLDSWLDICLAGDLFVLSLISITSLAFYAALLFATCPSQISYISELNSRFKKCIETNDEIFARCINSATLASFERASELMNGNLVKVLLEYDIFAEQFAATRGTLATLVTLAPAGMFTVNIAVRLHLPYYKQNIYWLSIMFCLLAVLTGNSICVNPCRVYYSSAKLYKSISSLLAHSIELNLRSNKLVRRDIYSAHLVWLQRNILFDYQRFMNQFAAEVYDEPVTMSWTDLVRWNYFYSLLLISSVFQLKSWKTLLGSRLDDPLGLYV